eukprot:m.98361 g.98361  ORF g.98361 m.98361 type:complete len:108 (+) comp15079_c0_seq1:98-421(+)
MSMPPNPLRIASLLPSATEIVGRLGLAAQLVGVSHECDICPDKAGLSAILSSRQAVRLTQSSLQPDVESQSAIDTKVKRSTSTTSLYDIDRSIPADSAQRSPFPKSV